MRDLIVKQIDSSMAVKKAVLNDEKLIGQIEALAISCINSLKSGGKIIFAGNGGSFLDAQHLSAEFTSRFIFDRDPLASIALGTNNSSISAIANDYGYDKVFARELLDIGKIEDIFIPISTSGNSPNILRVIEYAKQLGLSTVGMTGVGGEKMAKICECLSVPSSEIARIQECHIMIGHIVCGIVEQHYLRKSLK